MVNIKNSTYGSQDINNPTILNYYSGDIIQITPPDLTGNIASYSVNTSGNFNSLPYGCSINTTNGYIQGTINSSTFGIFNINVVAEANASDANGNPVYINYYILIKVGKIVDNIKYSIVGTTTNNYGGYDFSLDDASQYNSSELDITINITSGTIVEFKNNAFAGNSIITTLKFSDTVTTFGTNLFSSYFLGNSDHKIFIKKNITAQNYPTTIMYLYRNTTNDNSIIKNDLETFNTNTTSTQGLPLKTTYWLPEPLNIEYNNDVHFTLLKDVDSNNYPLSLRSPTILPASLEVGDYTITLLDGITLPTGLTINSTTGILSGTPTALDENSVFDLTISNGAGSSPNNIKIYIVDKVLTYTSDTISFPSSTLSLVKNNSYEQNIDEPFNDHALYMSYNGIGNYPTHFTIDQSLPTGLSFNTSDGTISGTPTAISNQTTYTISFNDGTPKTSTFTLEVTGSTGPTAPSNLTYSNSNVVVYDNTQGTIDVTSVNGGGTFTYTATYNGSSTLPTGISLNQNTGTITYAILDANVGYYSITITATNGVGSTNATVIINRGFVVNNLKYSFIDNLSTNLKVDGLNNTNSYNPDLVIPADVTNNSNHTSYNVTTISAYAFYFNLSSDFNNVTINEGITTINFFSFGKSINGTLILPSTLVNISNNAFNNININIIECNCNITSEGGIAYCSINTLFINSSVTSLYTTGSFFYYLYSLRKIVFRNNSNITSISNDFINIQNVDYLTNVNLIMIKDNFSYSYNLDKGSNFKSDITNNILNFNNTATGFANNYSNPDIWLKEPLTFTYGTDAFTLYKSVRYSYDTTTVKPTTTQEVTYSLINSDGTITTSLPDGLLLDGLTGKIYGTIKNTVATQTSVAYTIYAINNAGIKSGDVKITILEASAGAPTNVKYGNNNSITFTINNQIPDNLIIPTYTNNGVPITSYTMFPPLPDTLSLNETTGEITGYMLTETQSTPYYITGHYGSGGTVPPVTLNLTFTKEPTYLSYNKSYIYYLNDDVNIPPPTYYNSLFINITSYSLTQSIILSNYGLTLNTTTGAITGKCTKRIDVPNAFIIKGNYTVNGVQKYITTTLDLRIKNIAPTILKYLQNGVEKTNFTLNVNTLLNQNSNMISPNSDANLTSYSITNSIIHPTISGALLLNNGMYLDTSTGKIRGMPNISNITYDYTITGKNSLGAISTTITISIIDRPAVFYYDANEYSNQLPFPINRSITPFSAYVNFGLGEKPNYYTISPVLPAGLLFNNASAQISGTPTEISTQKIYTITGTNSGGSSTTTLSLSVAEIPPNISVSSAPYTYTKGTAIPSLNVSNNGGLIESFTITEVNNTSQTKSLPSGLTANLANGIITISGTPTQTSGFGQEISYQINAINSVGTSSATIKIIVNDIAPTISYSTSNTVTRASTINPISPTISVNGGTPTSYSISSVSPATSLPAGLSFNNTTGIITGTVTSTIYDTFSYDIMATNTGGNSNTVRISITVNDIGINFGYNLPTTFIVGVTPTTYSPINNNLNNQSLATSFAASIDKPSWISINTTTGLLTFSPSSANFGQTSLSTFTITGTNSTTGATSYTYTVPVITVVDKAPDFTYGDVTIVLGTTYVNSTSTNNFKPSVTGNSGTISSYSIGSSPLPSGVYFNTTTGVIYGILNTISSLNLTGTPYTITSTNSGGIKNVTFTLKVIDKVPNFTTGISSINSNLVVGTSYTYNAVNVNNIGVATNFSISPSIPGSISINSTTGAVTIAPIQSQAGTSITLTLTGTNNNDPNSKTQFTQTISIVDKAPSFSYATVTLNRLPNNSNSSHTINPTINANSGVITSFTTTTSLPAGLELNSNGSITGRPTSLGTNTYTITGTNSGGTSNQTITIIIEDTAPTNLKYNNTQELTLYVGTPYNIIPTTDTGYVESYALVTSFASDLGLTFNTGTLGSISGTPKKTLDRKLHTINLINNNGARTTPLNIYITIIDRPSPQKPIQYFMRSAFSNNLLGYYKKGSTRGSIGGTVSNSRAVRRRT